MALSTQKEIYQAVYPAGPPKGSIGWHRSAFDADIDNAAEFVKEDGAWSAHLAADDLIQAVSSAGGDTTQTLYVRGIGTDNKVRIESFALNGATAVDSAANLRYVECGWLSAACAGTITVRRKTGPATIFTITIGQLQNYAVHHLNGEYTTYLTGLWCGAGGTMADSVNLDLRHYPSDASTRALTTGFVHLVQPTIYVDLTATAAVTSNPPPIIFPQPIRIPSGSYIALYGTGEAANNNVWAFLQGFDVKE